MPEFFETDDIVKGYDRTIVARIFRYVKPYRALLAVAAIALAVTTVGELVLPVIVQRTVDDALVASWTLIDGCAAGDPRLGGFEPAAGERVAGRLFARKSDLAAIKKADRESLAAEGLLDQGPYYRTPWTEGAAALPARIRADLASYGGGLGSASGGPGAASGGPGAASGGLGAALSGPVLSDGWFVAPESYVLSLAPADASALRKADTATVSRNGAIFLFLLAGVLAATFAQAWTTSLIGQRVMKDLRMDLFRRTVSQSLAFLSRQPVGRLVTRLTSDVETINEFFTSVVVSFIKDFSVMIGVLGVLFAMSPRLALVTVLSLPPVLVVTSISRRKARDAFRRQRTWLSKVNAYLAEHIAGISVVKLFGRERACSVEFGARNRELMKANLGEMYVYATFRPLIEFFSATSTAIVLWYGAGLHDGGLISLGTLIAFVNLVRMFYSPLQDISEKYTILQSAMAGGERVFALLDADERVPDEAVRPMPSPLLGRVEFDRVWFAYKDEEWVIKDLSFTVEPGQTVAIVGYTGAGKSTVGSLMTRLWDVQKGEIRLDGVPVRQLPLKCLRASVRPVLQDVFLFSGSVAENIDLGLGLPRAAIEAAARSVKADLFIDELPGRYDEKLGEGASTLSSGQRQLLSFARVVAHDPAIVMLDEATSSVDTETERLVQAGLAELMRGRTTVAIAHRLSTIKHADTILVLSEGRLAESGDHDSLIARRGIYYNLYRLQYEREAGTTS